MSVKSTGGIKSGIILLCICIFLKESHCQCQDNECYQRYQNIIGKEADSIKDTFDGLLEKYNDVEGILKDLLQKLNTTILNTDGNLNNLENNNNDIKERNEKSNYTLLTLAEDKEFIEEQIKNISISKHWVQELAEANQSANSIITVTPTLEGINENERELEKWKEFLDKFNKTNYAKDIMSIPHSVSDDLDLLEVLLVKDPDSKCFDKFHDGLKNIFAQLADVLNLDNYDQKLTRLQKRTEKTKDKANNILKRTMDVLEAEKKLKEVNELANETLNLASDIEEIKNNIDGLLEDDNGIFDEELQELYKKYDIEKYRKLLAELEDIKNQINDDAGGENFNAEELEKEIESYIKEIDYYTCVLNDCEYRTPADAKTSFDCKEN